MAAFRMQPSRRRYRQRRVLRAAAKLFRVRCANEYRIHAFGSDREARTRFVGVQSSEYLTIGAEYKFGDGTQFDAPPLVSICE